MGEDFVHRLSSEAHPLSDEHLMILLLTNISMRLEARSTHVKVFILPMPSEEEMREVTEIDRRARILRLSTVRRLQLSGGLEHSRACADKSIIGDDNGHFKFHNVSLYITDKVVNSYEQVTYLYPVVHHQS
jgi:hypothetical protein